MYWRSCSNTTLVGAWSLGWSQVIHRCMGPHVWYHNIIKLPTRCCLVCSWHVDIVSVWPVGFETKKSASAACSISSRHKGGSKPKGGCSGHPPAGYPAGDGSSPAISALAMLGQASRLRQVRWEGGRFGRTSQVTGPEEDFQMGNLFSRFQTVNR